MRTATASRTLGLDTVQPLTPAVLGLIWAAGYRWVARYLRPDGQVEDEPSVAGDFGGCWSLSRRELADIIATGFAVVPIQFGPGRGTTISSAGGHERGRAMVRAARGLGLPQGCHLWCDAEGRRMDDADGDGHPGTPLDATACRLYLDAWAGEVRESGYACGLYVGPGLPLSGLQLYQLPGVSAYWSSATKTQTPVPRGWSIVQSKLYDGHEGEATVYGLACDLDLARRDDRGDYFHWVVG
ncbi:MAG: DUF1906 domain-containing protein [Planctomycetes bacterium]|jgi:hypothetical protein|nr:DUF1906 domain-containing protein [Planctomycetota bacterium]